MWSNQRLFSQMIDTLADDIIPSIDEPFSQKQAVALRSILKNLASRMEVKTDHIKPSNQEIIKLLEDLNTDHCSKELIKTIDSTISQLSEDSFKRHEELNRCLEEVIEYLWQVDEHNQEQEQLHERIRSVLRSQLDRKLEVTH